MRSRITYANVAATLALFLALGGTSYAITVGADDVVNNSLTGKDLRNESIRPADIAGLGANVVVRTGPSASGSIAAASSASCQGGETLISGGYSVSGNVPPATILDQPQPSSGKPTSWQVTILANPPNTGTISVTPYALCAS